MIEKITPSSKRTKNTHLVAKKQEKIIKMKKKKI